MKWYVLLCVTLVVVACAGSCVGMSLLGPNIFTGWRTAIYPVSAPAETRIDSVDPPQDFPSEALPATSSLNYDETNSDPLPAGQSRLVAEYLRLESPISQQTLESAVAAIQQEAANVQAETYEGATLTLNQNQAWFVWCSNGTEVDPPADVSIIHEQSLLADGTVGQVWIQIPFADGVPLRSDDTWQGCESFWAVKVH